MSVVPKDCIRLIAESVGIGNPSDDVLTNLGSDVEYRLREVIQEALKFVRHSKRTKLTPQDINDALRVKNVEPLFGFQSREPVQYRQVPADKTLFFVEDKELDLTELINAPLPKCPMDVTFTAHWLAVEGVQPAIPENPPVVVTTEQNFTKPQPEGAKKEVSVTAPGVMAVSTSAMQMGLPTETRPAVKHELSKELQMYYENMTQAILSPDERLKTAALESIGNDPGLQQLLPYLVQFVTDHVTSHSKNLPVLMAMMRLVKAMLDNTNLFVEPYLHQLMSSILTCILKKSVSQHPSENHWALRDLGSQLIATICRRWGDKYPVLQTRVTRTLLRGFLDGTKGFTTNYGAIKCLAELGPNVVHVLILPNLKAYSAILEPAISSKNTNPQKREEAIRVQQAILDAVGRFLKYYSSAANIRGLEPAGAVPAPEDADLPKPDVSETYDEVFGIFGEKLLPYVTDANREVLDQVLLQLRQSNVKKLPKKKKDSKKTKSKDNRDAMDVDGEPGGTAEGDFSAASF